MYLGDKSLAALSIDAFPANGFIGWKLPPTLLAARLRSPTRPKASPDQSEPSAVLAVKKAEMRPKVLNISKGRFTSAFP